MTEKQKKIMEQRAEKTAMERARKHSDKMNGVREQYSVRYENALVPVARRLEHYIRDCLCGIPRIDRIVARAKSVDRFISKAATEHEGTKKYSDPLNQIQDQIGARIITFYLNDIDPICEAVESYFRPIEDKTLVPDSDAEFGYFGRHYILLLPRDVLKPDEPSIPPFFELQIKTLFQHAWSEANHDLGYKTEYELDSHFRRKLAFTSAQAWGADLIFNELKPTWAIWENVPGLLSSVGEIAREANDLCWCQANGIGRDDIRARLYEEAVQTAAVALAIVECLIRNKWRWPEQCGHNCRRGIEEEEK